MSLYRTWRPKSFTDLVGQDVVVRTLRTALDSGKLAHAYLFSGPRGSGKTSAAKILARCIDCVRGPTSQPDNTCEHCVAMLAGTALDVIEIDAASNRGIDEIRSLRESAKFAPASMRAKVFIVDEAHMLTREGANAFLKTLEEPPPHVVFILATTAPEALPATILSRCQRYAFRRIPIGVMIDRMREIATAEGIAIDDGALGAIAYRADGGLRDALTMLEQVAAYGGPGGTIDAATVDAAFGATGRQYASALVDAILGARAADALRVVDEASDAGADMTGLIRGAIAEYRNLLVARIDPGLLSRDLSETDARAVVTLAGTTAQPRVTRGLRLLADALAAGRESGNPRLELETAVLRLVVAREDASLEALATRVALLEAGAPEPAPRPASAAVAPEATRPAKAAPRRAPEAPPPAAAAPTSPPAPAAVAAPTPPPVVAATPPPAPAPAAPTLQQVRSLWEQIRLRAEERSKPLATALSRASVDDLDGATLTITLPDEINASMLRDKLAILETAASDVLRTPLRIALRTRAGAGAGRVAPPRAPAATSGHRATPPAPAPKSAPPPDGEIDLLAYAAERLRGTEHP